MYIKFKLVIFLLVMGITSSISQGIYTESDIAAQDLLIAAKKEVLLGDLEEAVKIYKRLLEEHNEIAAAYELSRIYVKNDDFSTALTYAQRAYDAEPSNQWYLIQLTDLLSLNNNDEEAAKLYEKYTQEDPLNEYHYLQASYHYLKADQPKDAIKILDKLEENRGITEEIIQRKFEIYDVMGKEKDALKELEKLSEMYPSETRYLHNIAGYLRSMDKESDANKVMTRILEIDPDDETALLFSKSSGKNKDANYLRSLVPVIKDQRIDLDKKVIELIPYLQEFANTSEDELGQSLLDITLIMDEIYPKNAKVKSILGDIYFYSQKLENASEAYAASVDIDKSIWTVWSQLFLTLDLIQDFKTMREYSEKAIDVYPNQALAYYYNSVSYLEIGDLGEAQMSAAEARMVSGNNPAVTPEINLLESKIKFNEKDYDSSLELIKKAISGATASNPRMLEHQGDVLWALDEQSAAKESWKMAIKAGGNPDRINKKISGEANLNN
ncbi:tetratricopeptide repeat protein [Portibacter marinus]|uniref:tetratricopeptide repeat protein n=1 Tax=Portibacter marinus TaxID=2898660 RepID=UPI001F210DCB|nr:tetratricopeptide repeat protein [Portibacter marinus]